MVIIEHQDVSPCHGAASVLRANTVVQINNADTGWKVRGTRPAEAVETDSNDEPAADANGDSDDERSDENQAVPDLA